MRHDELAVGGVRTRARLVGLIGLAMLSANVLADDTGHNVELTGGVETEERHPDDVGRCGRAARRLSGAHACDVGVLADANVGFRV